MNSLLDYKEVQSPKLAQHIKTLQDNRLTPGNFSKWSKSMMNALNDLDIQYVLYQNIDPKAPYDKWSKHYEDSIKAITLLESSVDEIYLKGDKEISAKGLFFHVTSSYRKCTHPKALWL